MKNYRLLLPFLCCWVLLSCDKKSKVEKAVEEIPLQIKVNRFDKAFFETQPQDLPKLKAEYPFFFPAGNDDQVWIEKMQNPQWRELYTEVQKRYGNFSTETTQIEELFKHIKYYFPGTKIPKVYTIIAEMDYQNKVIYTGNMLVISLELYLGKDHRFYEFPQYLKQNFEPSQMMPDIASSFAKTKILPPTDTSFLSQMVYAGKELYLKDILLPEASDAEKMGYKNEQITWAKENEGYIWRYFIDNKMLYDTDQKLIPRFINPAPFSKFYLEIDNDSPGRIGAWIGWQMVRSYMENNEVSVGQLLKVDAKELFEKSHYKPKKNE
ncbi:gliding motility lipoprotein GldB [Flavobacterium sp. CYK-4]|uniref:gliding motility lipoprotein GldB n=1 Tax=Flavobacterium lotistagni TaxID=2709660 RepID=UPI00140A2027|nr:gliding motility lipoprotein GldB [Flavobacterium lotistagni]NHM05763.1 gliding motility lipoprotein GldB [Flavobacterium lotistagni]